MADITSEEHWRDCRDEAKELLESGYSAREVAMRLSTSMFKIEKLIIQLHLDAPNRRIAYQPIGDFFELPFGIKAPTSGLPKTLLPLSQTSADRELSYIQKRRDKLLATQKKHLLASKQRENQLKKGRRLIV